MDQEQKQRAPRDLGTSSDRAMFSPSDARDEDASSEGGQDHERAPAQAPAQKGTPERGGGRDVGRTQGGGSGGHSPSQDLQEQVDIRNNPKELND